jgi:ribonuclease Z
MSGSPLRITTVGTGAVRVNPRRGGPCHLIEAQGLRIVVDCGRCAVHHLGQLGIQPESIDLVCITHLHFDHVCDLPLLALLGWNNGRETGLRVLGPVGTERFLHHAIDEAYTDDIASRLAHGKDPAGLRWTTTEIETDGRCHHAGELAVSCVHTPHAGLRNLNYRFELGNHHVVVTSDTNLTPELVHLCRNADLLVCECSGSKEFLASVPWGGWHMNPQTVARLAREANVAQVVLAHLVVEDWSTEPDIADQMASAVRRAFSGPVAVATDGAVFEVG